MSENKLADWEPDEDTQSVSDQPPMSREQFTAQCERQKADYMERVHDRVGSLLPIRPTMKIKF